MMRTILVLLCLLCFVSARTDQKKPVLYLIGDSTVKNGGGRGADGLWGWGDFLALHFDTARITIENHARGGRSSRTYQTEGLWNNVLEKLRPGDFVIIQFGHNDGGPLNDTLRARGTIRGVGEETEVIDNLITKQTETVHTYGWYIRKYIQDTKAKGATPIVCSLVARNIWKDGRVERASATYTQWAKAAAETGGAFFIDLNDLVASRYEKLGQEAVKSKLFLKDHTHTTEEGAGINASLVAGALKELKDLSLVGYLKN
jgi:rhamnogalacturonan acetylesterase